MADDWTLEVERMTLKAAGIREMLRDVVGLSVDHTAERIMAGARSAVGEIHGETPTFDSVGAYTSTMRRYRVTIAGHHPTPAGRLAAGRALVAQSGAIGRSAIAGGEG